MIEAWAPTIIATAALGLIFFYLRTGMTRLQEEHDRAMKEIKVDHDKTKTRLKKDEALYLTEDKHDLICNSRQSDIKLHINNVVAKQRQETDNRFRSLYKRLDEIKDMIKNGQNKK
jgi:hypothetical protein